MMIPSLGPVMSEEAYVAHRCSFCRPVISAKSLFLFYFFVNTELVAQTGPIFEGVLDKTHPQVHTQTMKITLKYTRCLVWDHMALGKVQTSDKPTVGLPDW